MIRNLKVLGLALVAVFAFSAMVASAASAQQGTLTSTGPVTLTGSEITGTTNALTAFGAVVKCPGSTYSGHKVGGSGTEFLESGATTATITPHYVNCEQKNPNDTTVDMNSCDYVFHVGNTTVANTYAVTADVVCPAGNKIKVTGPACTVEVGAQTGLSGPVLKHTTGTADDIDLEGTFTGVHATTSAACLDLSTTTAELHVHLTITGHNEAGTSTAVTITG